MTAFQDAEFNMAVHYIHEMEAAINLAPATIHSEDEWRAFKLDMAAVMIELLAIVAILNNRHGEKTFVIRKMQEVAVNMTNLAIDLINQI